MKLQKIAIVFEEADLIELQTILLDEDERAAFRYIKRLVNKIELQQRQQCGSALVKGESQ